MSEPADEEVLVPEQQQQSSTEEVVVQEEPKQQQEEKEEVVVAEATEEIQPVKEEQEKEDEVEIQQEVEEKNVSAESVQEDMKLELPNLEAEESQSQEEQQQQSQDDEKDEPEKTMDDSQDTVQMPITDTQEKALEDEEMPSMVTISSTSRIDESEFYKQDESEVYKQDESETCDKQDEESKLDEVVEKYSPQPVVAQRKDDSDSDSVVMIDDDDDEEEEPRRNYDDREYERNDRRRSRHDDDEEDEEESSYEDEYDGSSSYESDGVDEDEEQYNDKYDRSRYKRNDRRDIDEDVEDDDEEDEDGENEEDEYMDDQSCGDGGSDDAILRPNSNGLSKQQKERSSSLQDLSLIQGSSPKNRHNVNPFSQKAIFERSQGKAKPYAHVPSKVKQYIDNGAEQRRISSEKRKKSIDEARQRNDEPSDVQSQRSQEVAMACQSMKNYAEKTLKEVAESEENEKMIFLQQGVENGEISLIPRQMMPSHNVEIMNKANEMEIDLVDEEDEKRPMYNGTMPKEHQNHYVTERKGIMRRQDGPLKSSIFNGEEDPLSFQQPLDNCRALSYDEYMKGPISEVNEVVINRIEVSEVQSISMQNAEIEDDSGLRIESVVSNFSEEKVVEDFQTRKTPPPMMNNQQTFYQENPEVQNLQEELNRRNLQFESLSQAYQKTVSESMAMRMELENLRKAVAHYQEQMKPTRPETRVSGVQTEIQAKTRDTQLIDLEGIDPKLGVSAVSTQWSDTTGSAATISMDPPNVTTALNSDESGQSKTSLPKRNALSRAFMTSTKILQTLSSIAHGKTRVDKIVKPKIAETEKSTKPGPKSKKRKASDTLDESTQPTKIPKSNDQEGITPTTPEPQFVNPNTMQQESEEKKDEEQQAEDLSDEDVKVYVYPEDEEGHERSFLIQAKEVSSPKPGVRECGPYLLGNVEVYMTEVNGTINIWGKELSQTSQTTEDPDASVRSKDLRQNLRWQSTPRIFNKNEGAATTSKKSRMVPRYMQPSQYDNHCEHNHRSSMPSCHDHHHQHQHQHHNSCCSPSVVESPCGCVHEQVKRTPGCCKAKSMPNVNQNCCCGGHKPLARRHSFNPTDEEDSDDSDEANRTLQAESFSPHSFSKNKSMHQRSAEPRRSTGGSSNEPSSMCENENDPLIAARQVMEGLEGPEKKRKKKVRGILMDLLRKGCVTDCRTTNPMERSNLHHVTSIYEPSTSAQHKASCLPSQHTHRPNERCSSCTKPDKTQQLESQMERFREEMEKLRSQSDTLAGMIQALKNADVIN